MRKLWASLLLGFCLVFSQQGALLHELGHLAPRAGAAQQDEDTGKHAVGGSCPLCLSFAQIAGIAVGVVKLPPLLAFEDHWATKAGFSARPADLPRQRARDPPILL